MDRRLGWIVWKGAFAVALYCAVIEQIYLLQYALVAFVWYMLATTLAALLDGPATRPIEALPVPLASAMAFDLGVLATMFLAHWYWTAFAYAVSCGSLALIQARRTSG